MFYQVTLRIKGHASALDTAECTDDEIGYWCERAKALAKEQGQPVLAEFKPREKIFEYKPE